MTARGDVRHWQTIETQYPGTPDERQVAVDSGRQVWVGDAWVDTREVVAHVDIEVLRPVLLDHHPVASELGALKGCRCGGVRLGQDVIAHVAEQVLKALTEP